MKTYNRCLISLSNIVTVLTHCMVTGLPFIQFCLYSNSWSTNRLLWSILRETSLHVHKKVPLTVSLEGHHCFLGNSPPLPKYVGWLVLQKKNWPALHFIICSSNQEYLCLTFLINTQALYITLDFKIGNVNSPLADRSKWSNVMHD